MQNREISKWRKKTRTQLLALRSQVSNKDRQRYTKGITHRLWHHTNSSQSIGVYWPIRGEVDLRTWMCEAHAKGKVISLPVVQGTNRKLTFRHWSPGCEMRNGAWNIPEPVRERTVQPDTLIIPLLGGDAQHYRLGYGGGYYDRTLASLSTHPLTIGVGLPCAKIPTIHPQQHDIALQRMEFGD